MHQLVQLLRLTLVYRVDPLTYYGNHLYDAPMGLAEVEHYLGRYEMKNGIYNLLRELRREDPNFDFTLSEKLRFTENCIKAGIRATPVLATARNGVFTMVDPAPDALERNLFVKTIRGRGAFGTQTYHWVDGGYVAADGSKLTSGEMIARIEERSKSSAVMVARKLENHPEIADLAEQSLIVFRVFTCFDAEGVPVVTHGMLRILSKIEPNWRSKEEWGAAVDLTTGILGPMCGDLTLTPDAWWDRQPNTGAPVTGRKIAGWPAMAALAVAAHRVHGGRMVIGWDIALTPEGPVMIEGNSDADTHFLQRVHRQMIGHSPLGPLLRHHLLQVEKLVTR